MTRVFVLDTTLRDGEQCPGASMTASEKLRLAEELDALGVDLIEVGAPGASSQDFEAVRAVSARVRRPIIVATAGTSEEEIDRAADALADAGRARLHIVSGAVDASADPARALESRVQRIRESVTHARARTGDVQLSVEDATRLELSALCRLVEAAVEAGASTVGLVDSLGHAVPADFRRLLDALRASVRGVEQVTLSVRCRNDLGLAVATTLAAVQHGARQVEATINGLGARAGNAALEEIVMALRLRPDLGPFETGVKSERLHSASQLLVHVTGIRTQPTKPIVGENAFAHEAEPQASSARGTGLHEVITPEMVGARRGRLVLGRHSGRQAFLHRLKELGYELEGEQAESAYQMFRLLAESKKTVLDEDLLAIYYEGTLHDAPRSFKLEHLQVVCGRRPSKATVRVSEGGGPAHEATAEGDGPIDATFAALQEVIPWEARLESFVVQAASPGTDAVGEVHLHLRVSGHVFTGRSASTDIVDAAARAFLNAVDKAAHARQLEAKSFERAEYWGV
jgi:2-isopropylmalate synthase